MGEATVTRTMLAVLGALLALLSAWSAPLSAQVWSGERSGKNMQVELVLEQPPEPGKPVIAALYFTPRTPDWHGYWSNPGDAGLGMQIAWTLPEGWQAGEPLYPVPRTLRIGGLMNHVYKGNHAVLVPMSAGAGAGPVRAVVDYLACTDQICVPEQAAVTLQAPASGRDARFDGWRGAVAPDIATPVRYETAGEILRLAVPLPEQQALGEPHVFIATERLVEASGPQRFFRAGDMLVAELPLSGRARSDQVSGILSFDEDGIDGVRFTAVPGGVPTGLAPLGSTPSAGTLLLLVGGALLGGLLLNIMPCVFPILSLKALTLARAGVSQREARADGLAYTAGAVLACVGLGAAILLLRAAGEQVGWAFQLQEPAVVVALFLLALAITANFLGLFEVPSLPMTGGTPGGAFGMGLLAAFVATPCTGPFMAAALGAALLLPVPLALAMFAALGLGLGLPFLLLGFVPALRNRLPRPGAWMERFRRWMALPMGLTAAALAWLLWRLGGAGYLAMIGLAGAVLLGLLVLYGLGQRRGGRSWLAGLGAVAAGLLALLVVPPPAASHAATADSLLDAQPFSDHALAQARASGKPVFVWFTADWCVSCKVNEGVAIERESTRAAFDRAGVIALRGDWTRRDPEITRFLTSQGAAGVPLYLWYPAADGAAKQLPQVLTPGTLTDLAEASEQRRVAER